MQHLSPHSSARIVSLFLSLDSLRAVDFHIPDAVWTEESQRSSTHWRLAENFHYQKEVNFLQGVKALQLLAPTHIYVMTFMQGLILQL